LNFVVIESKRYAIFMLSDSKPLLISFSGIDGAGKSTQIDRLHARLLQAGASVVRLAFWDNVAFMSRFRAGVSHRFLGGEQGIGAPGKPVARNDKNDRRWYLTLARSPLYLLDVLSLRRVVARARAARPDVIIFDRYIYDQLAHVPDCWIGRSYVRWLLNLAPRPSIAYLLDACPEAALERKPEYPLNFLYRYRNSYFALRSMASEMVVIPALDVDSVERTIWQEFYSRYPTQRPALNGRAASTPERIIA
jgi:thymidylate kinase